MNITKKFYAKDRKAWRDWLKKNHKITKEIWLVYCKKGSGRTRVAYKDALEEALCFGWIDGQVKGIDEKKYAQRFTPRRSKSSWSIANVKHYKRLLRRGLVSETGKEVFRDRRKVYDPRAESVIYQIRNEFQKRASQKKAKILSRFFKTGKGEYAEGDRFFGVTVPETRKIAKKYSEQTSLSKIEYILYAGKHEERLCALLILIDKFSKGDEKDREKIFKLYLKSTKHINNWDLVDLSADKIIGAYLYSKPSRERRRVLLKLSKSRSLWERRIAIISTFYSIKNNKYSDTLLISQALLGDSHDLIHKAVGWMLREVGNRDRAIEERFLRSRYKKMPRTMLRYAIERFPESLRKKYLVGKV